MRPTIIGGSVVLLACAACSGGPPEFLSLTQSVTTVRADAGEHLVVTAVVVPGGPGTPLAGGELLRGPQAALTCGAFHPVTDATFEIDVGFDDLLTDDLTSTPGGQVTQQLTARFRDNSGQSVSQTLSVDLSCGPTPDTALCNGRCTDVHRTAAHCGACGKVCQGMVDGTNISVECGSGLCGSPEFGTATRPSCAAFCATFTFRGRPMTCAPSCHYTMGHDLDGDTAAFVAYTGVSGNRYVSIKSCDQVPDATSYVSQWCCCVEPP